MSLSTPLDIEYQYKFPTPTTPGLQRNREKLRQAKDGGILCSISVLIPVIYTFDSKSANSEHEDSHH